MFQHYKLKKLHNYKMKRIEFFTERYILKVRKNSHGGNPLMTFVVSVNFNLRVESITSWEI